MGVATRSWARLANEFKEIAKDPKAHIPRFLGVELHAGDVPALHDCREGAAVLRDGDRLTAERRRVTVCEVHLCARRDTLDNRHVTLYREAVPADVGDFDGVVRLQPDRVIRGVRLQPDRAQTVAAARQQAETGELRRFVAAFVEPLHAQADAEQRPTFADAGQDRVDPGLIERPGRAEVSDAGDDDAARLGQIAGRFWHEDVRPDRGERFLHRRQVAGLVIDERDHSRPLVLGNMRASRRSFAQATRSARANALKTASILWWLDRP